MYLSFHDDTLIPRRPHDVSRAQWVFAAAFTYYNAAIILRFNSRQLELHFSSLSCSHSIIYNNLLQPSGYIHHCTGRLRSSCLHFYFQLILYMQLIDCAHTHESLF